MFSSFPLKYCAYLTRIAPEKCFFIGRICKVCIAAQWAVTFDEPANSFSLILFSCIKRWRWVGLHINFHALVAQLTLNTCFFNVSCDEDLTITMLDIRRSSYFKRKFHRKVYNLSKIVIFIAFLSKTCLLTSALSKVTYRKLIELLVLNLSSPKLFDTPCPSSPAICAPVTSPVDNFAERASSVSNYVSPTNKWKSFLSRSSRNFIPYDLWKSWWSPLK